MAKKKSKKTTAKKAPARRRAPAKKTAPKRKKAATKKAARPKRATTAKKTATKKKAAKKPAKKVARKKAPAGTARTRVATKSKTARKKTTKKTATTLGRPRVPADAQLDLVFRKDYEAREVFGFLGVTTVRELEKFGPDQIIRLLTGPMVQTVGRIRKGMAMCNRSLDGDKAFALEFKQKVLASSSSAK